MKNKNLFLLLLLILVLSLTYIFEERGNEKSFILESLRTKVLNFGQLGNLLRVQGLKVDFYKKENNFYSQEGNILMSTTRLNEYFKILEGLKIKTFLKEEDVLKVGRSFYIPDEALKLRFQFEQGEMVFSLGKKLNFDQTFYMEVIQNGQKKIIIASDESPDPGVYQTDQEYQRSGAKYNRLMMLFMLTNNYFYDTRVFKDFYSDPKSIHIEEMAIATFRNKKFSINFKKTATLPAAPSGIDYFEENWLSFHRSFTQLEAKSLIHPYAPNKLLEILSQLEVVDRYGRNYTLTLYKKYDQQNGYFLSSSLDKNLYLLKPEDARIFFVNIQDFWKKRIFFLAKEYSLGIMFYNQKKDLVKIYDSELFKVESLSPTEIVRPLEFKKLIDFLKTEADHVKSLSFKPAEVLSKKVLDLNFDQLELSVILEDNDLILVDLLKKIEFHYYVGTKLPFSLKRIDYFEAIKKSRKK